MLSSWKDLQMLKSTLYLSMSSKTDEGSHTYSSILLMVGLSHLLIMSVWWILIPLLRIRHKHHLPPTPFWGEKKQPILYEIWEETSSHDIGNFNRVKHWESCLMYLEGYLISTNILSLYNGKEIMHTY